MLNKYSKFIVKFNVLIVVDVYATSMYTSIKLAALHSSAVVQTFKLRIHLIFQYPTEIISVKCFNSHDDLSLHDVASA